MKIFVKAKPNSKENKVIPPPLKLWDSGDLSAMPAHAGQSGRKDEYYTVSVKDPPKQGKANLAVIKILAEYFNLTQSNVTLVSGASSKIKVFEISK